MRRLTPEDCKRIAGMCARHQSGDAAGAAARFCHAQNLAARDKLRIKRLAERQSAIVKACEKAAEQGYLVAMPDAAMEKK